LWNTTAFGLASKGGHKVIMQLLRDKGAKL